MLAHAVCAQLARRGLYRFAQNYEATVFGECAAHGDIFAGEPGFIESTDRIKSAARAEEKASGSNPADPEQPGEELLADALTARQRAQHFYGTTPAHRAIFHSVKCCLYQRAINQGIGIDEHEQVALGDCSAGIARGRDMSVLNLNDLSTRPSRDCGRGIGRSVDHNDDFASGSKIANGRLQRVQGCPDQALFVMCRHDE